MAPSEKKAAISVVVTDSGNFKTRQVKGCSLLLPEALNYLEIMNIEKVCLVLVDYIDRDDRNLTLN